MMLQCVFLWAVKIVRENAPASTTEDSEEGSLCERIFCQCRNVSMKKSKVALSFFCVNDMLEGL